MFAQKLILRDQVLQLLRIFLKVNFRFLQEPAKDYLCQMLKNFIGFVWLKTEIINGDQVLSPRYGFFQRTITKQHDLMQKWLTF